MDEDIVIPLIVFSFILSLIWMILSHSKWKYKQQQEIARASDNSLRTSELKELMREAVEEATEPLTMQIQALEAQLRELKVPRLMPARNDALREDIDPVDEEIQEPSRRRVT